MSASNKASRRACEVHEPPTHEIQPHLLNPQPSDKPLLVPLTSSLYVPGKLSDTDHVIVDVGTGFYVEKTTDDAQKFYNGKVEELETNIKELENIVNGKANNLRVVEEVLRQKVLAGPQGGQGGGEGG